MRHCKTLLFITSFLFLLFNFSSQAAAEKEGRLLEIVAPNGSVYIQKAGSPKQIQAMDGMKAGQGDKIITKANSNVILFASDTEDHLYLSENSALFIEELYEEDKNYTSLRLISGDALVNVTPIYETGDHFTFFAHNETFHIKGTSFFVGVDPVTGQSVVGLFSGVINVTNPSIPPSNPVLVPNQQIVVFPEQATPNNLVMENLINSGSPNVLQAILDAKRQIDEENSSLTRNNQGITDAPDLDALRTNLDGVVLSVAEQARNASMEAQLQQRESLQNASLRAQKQAEQQKQLLAEQVKRQIEELNRKLEEQKRKLEEAKKQREDAALQKYLAALSEEQRQSFLQRQPQAAERNRENSPISEPLPEYSPPPAGLPGGDGNTPGPTPVPEPNPEPGPGNPECPDSAGNEECEGNEEENPDCPDGEGNPECMENPDCPNAVENPECEGNEEENPDCPDGEGNPECMENPDCPNAGENPDCEGNEEENPHCPDGEGNPECGEDPDCSNAGENPDCEGNEEKNPDCPDGEGNPECGERALLNDANSSIKQTAPLKSKVRKEKRIARGIKLVKLL